MRLIIAFVAALFCGTLSEAKTTDCIPYVKQKVPPPHKTALKKKVEAEAKNIVKFLLFTRENQNCYQLLEPGSINKTYFNSALSVRFIIHGWRNNAFSGVNREIKDAYLTKGNYNIIAVNWGNISEQMNYNHVSKRVDEVGEVVANFAETLHQEMRVPYEKMYVIGHSLGAHVAGHAGHAFKQKFEAIIALDPAGPNFKGSKNQSRIDQKSAKYVESIHTNMKLAGIDYPVGHASFFPNYGKIQKGCNRLSKCSHSRAYKYFAESINSVQGFWGIKCSSFEQIENSKCTTALDEIALMGGDPVEPKKGVYYFPTNKEKPFAKGQNF